MKVLVLGLNYAPEQIGTAVYTTGMAEALVRSGHEVRVVAGAPYYPKWQPTPGYRPWQTGVERGVWVMRVPHYIPKSPTGARRLLHHASFALTSFGPMLWQGLMWRPDVVLAVAPSLMAAPGARLSARFAGAHAWLHLQDFEVEAALAMHLAGGPATGLTRLAAWVERTILRSFETVSSISPQMCRRLIDKQVPAERIVEFRNWAQSGPVASSAAPSYREQWNLGSKHVALYAGSVGRKQGLGLVIEAARTLQYRKDLVFLICGDGPCRAELEAQAAGLENIQFHDVQPRERLAELMAMATVHLLPQRAEAADLVLPSKLATMLASGAPIVASAAEGTGLAIEIAGCGLVTPPGETAAFAAAIVTLLEDAPLRETLGRNGSEKAAQRWSSPAILARFEQELVVRGSRPLGHTRKSEA